ncbi:MAG: hypothetical protein JNJ73_01055 [Hyphomonadaceae bacterium]|nr:hypothetical protein [Hyphomonadaceae bacterium]
MKDVIFRGQSGRLHRFTVHRPDADFPETAAVYAFARSVPGASGWAPVFLSRTANLSRRLAGHERWAEAQAVGATHILVHQRALRDVREFVEADLLESMRPVMNSDPIEAEAVEVEATGPRLVWAA